MPGHNIQHSIDEYVALTGSTIDLGGAANNTVVADVISERTSAAGVTVDGVLLKDSQVTTDVINEATGAAGVTVDGCLIKDGRAAKLATAAMFLSAEVTGDGNPQSTAHGLGATPTITFAFPSNLSGGACVITAGTHTSTNAVFTATSGEKYKIVAIL